MTYIKISLRTRDKKKGSTSKMTAFIFDNKSLVRFEDHKQAELAFTKMREDGKKVLFERGILIEFYANTKKEQIREFIKKDIDTLPEKLNVDILDYKETLEE